MSSLEAIAATWSWLDAVLEGERTRALTQDAGAVQRIEARQRLNEQAYFVLCWGQIEDEIDKRCRSAIRQGRGNSNWSVRRAWYLYDPDDRRLSGLKFEERAALVVDKDGGRGSPWAWLMLHYGTRNQIAHGTLLASQIDLAAVVREFRAIEGRF